MGNADDLIVSDDARRFLRLQRGDLGDGLNDAAFDAAYNRALRATYRLIAPHLPERCRAVLDIGAGLGGIDVLLGHRYDPTPRTYLVDGTGAFERHDRPFSSVVETLRFQAANGATRVSCVTPAATDDPGMMVQVGWEPVDLVVSFRAWGFHLAPERYLPLVLHAAAPDATIVIDVRRNRRSWSAALSAALGAPVAFLETGPKHETRVYRRAAKR